MPEQRKHKKNIAIYEVVGAGLEIGFIAIRNNSVKMVVAMVQI